jgi:two-component system sensor histidine kinase MprB
VPLRRRLAVATALAVGVAVALAAVVAYVVVHDELRAQVDGQLREQARLIADRPTGRFVPPSGQVPAPPPRRGGSAAFVQLVTPDGTVLRRGFETRELPLDAATRRLAAHGGPTTISELTVGGQHLRVLSAALPSGGVVQLARSLDGIDAVLGRLRWILVGLCAGGIALAALLGRLAARRLVAPIVRVTEAARHIERTEDLGRRIAVGSRDEVGELAERFNGMLDALERSVAAQRQLVADASHELRTPVTALRTNIEVLADMRDLAPHERARLLDDVTAQTEELGSLVGDLIELARGDARPAETEDVRLDALVAEALARARRHAPGVHFEAALDPAVIEGVPDRLARAVNNLLDNAAQHADAVEVRTGTSGVIVRDHGGGIPAADLPYLFDRFYRSSSSAARRGTGLGLAIVRQVAEQHGGSVHAANAPGGGAQFELRLPAAAPALEAQRG